MNKVVDKSADMQLRTLDEVGNAICVVEIGVTFKPFARLLRTVGLCWWADEDGVDDAACNRKAELLCCPCIATSLEREVEGFGDFSFVTGGGFVVDDEELIGVGNDRVDTTREKDVKIADGEAAIRTVNGESFACN